MFIRYWDSRQCICTRLLSPEFTAFDIQKEKKSHVKPLFKGDFAGHCPIYTSQVGEVIGWLQRRIPGGAPL